MLKEEILKSIYKYYPTIFETSNSYKDKLRKMKINNKIDLEEKLFKDIERTAEKHGVDKLVVLKEKNVYKFYLKRVDGFHYKIKLEKLDAIEIE